MQLAQAAMASSLSSAAPEEEEERSHSDAAEENDGGLPEDQVFELLTRVPLDDLAACRMVSTRWRRLTYEPAFAPLHCRRAAAVSGYIVQSMTRNRYHADFVTMHNATPGSAAISLDFLPSTHVRVEAVSAHRGLACCVDADTSCYYVCKPATRQWRALPSPRVRFLTAAVAMVAWTSAATATATSTAAAVEFKVVRFSVPKLQDTLRCEVFDSRRFAWRRAPDVPVCPNSLFQPASPAVRAYGAMHWLRWPDRLTRAQDVFAFDVRDEAWRIIPLPREVDDDPWARKRIAAVEGRLCLLVLTDGAAGSMDEEVLEVWEMASYGDYVGGRWRKKMTVSLKSLHAKEGSAVILRDLHSSNVAFLQSFCKVMWYDLRKGKMAEVQVKKHICIQEIFKYESDLIPCDIGRRGCHRSPGLV